MSFSNDWLGIEGEESKDSKEKEVDYMSVLRQQQILAYRQEMIKRQQQLQLQARNVAEVGNYPLLQQQQLLQRQINSMPTSVSQSQSYQAKIQQMQLIQRQLMQQNSLNQGSLPRSNSMLGNPMLTGNNTIPSVPNISNMPNMPNMHHKISSPVLPPNSNVGSSWPANGSVDHWTKGYLNFMKNIGKEVTSIPNINGQILNLKNFVGYVVDLGGFDKVMSENKWSQVASMMGLGSDVSEKVAYLYKSLLLDFERRVFPGLSVLAQAEIKKKMVNIPLKNNNDQIEASRLIQAQILNQTNDANSPRLVDSPYGSPAPDFFTDTPASPYMNSTVKESDPNLYMPKVRKVSSFGGYDPAILDLAISSQKHSLSSLGVIDLYRVKMSFKSQLDSDCQYAIDSFLAISTQRWTTITLDKYSEMIDAFFDLLYKSLLEAFGDNQSEITFNSQENISYINLYEMEMESMIQLRTDFESTFENSKQMLAERILAMSTALRNFSFDTENALFLSKHVSFWPVIHLILLICMDSPTKRCSPLTLKEAGILDHRKNLVIIFSNIGSDIDLPTKSSQLIMNLLEDFLLIQDSIYSYSALEALAKLSLVEENHKFFVLASNLKSLISHGAKFLPDQSFNSKSPQNVVAQWELASLFIYNISAMDDDCGRLIIAGSQDLIKSIIRISTAGLKLGNDLEDDYIRIITIRMLKCIRELSSNADCRNSLWRFESKFLRMIMATKVMRSSPAFKNEAGLILSDILSDLK